MPKKAYSSLIWIKIIAFSTGNNHWSDRAAKISFWSLSGLPWMVFATLFPLGVLQLHHSISSGYFGARTLQFINGEANLVIERLRLPSTSLGVFRFADEVAQRLNIAELVSEKLI
jgi:nitric oxide reductase large subunit